MVGLIGVVALLGALLVFPVGNPSGRVIALGQNVASSDATVVYRSYPQSKYYVQSYVSGNDCRAVGPVVATANTFCVEVCGDYAAPFNKCSFGLKLNPSGLLACEQLIRRGESFDCLCCK